MALSGLSSTATFALLDTGLRRPAAYAGVLTALQGLGSEAGGLVAGALMRRMPRRAFAALGLALFALGVPARATRGCRSCSAAAWPSGWACPARSSRP